MRINLTTDRNNLIYVEIEKESITVKDIKQALEKKYGYNKNIIKIMKKNKYEKQKKAYSELKDEDMIINNKEKLIIKNIKYIKVDIKLMKGGKFREKEDRFNIFNEEESSFFDIDKDRFNSNNSTQRLSYHKKISDLNPEEKNISNLRRTYENVNYLNEGNDFYYTNSLKKTNSTENRNDYNEGDSNNEYNNYYYNNRNNNNNNRNKYNDNRYNNNNNRNNYNDFTMDDNPLSYSVFDNFGRDDDNDVNTDINKKKDNIIEGEYDKKKEIEISETDVNNVVEIFGLSKEEAINQLRIFKGNFDQLCDVLSRGNNNII